VNRIVKNTSNIEVPALEKPAVTAGQTGSLNARLATQKAQQQDSMKERVSAAAKKEVEANPFKKLIDISDLIEFESNPLDVEKECQNILLRHNSDLKTWYNYYSRKVESVKTEESFSMTLRQVWRFLRDCQVIDQDATLAQFDRIYMQGAKNHYTLLGTSEMHKFDFMYGAKPTKSAQGGGVATSQLGGDSDFSEEEEDGEVDLGDDIKPEDVHDATKVILQRQFFEALIRAAAVKYANNAEMASLSDKVEALFNHKLVPLATKNKAKSAEDDKNFKIAESVFVQYEEQLRIVFKYFCKRASSAKQAAGGPAGIFGLKEDVTLDVTEIINLLQKSNLLDEKKLKTHEVIEIIEKYYTPGQRLKDKLEADNFKTYARQNPLLLPVNQEIASRRARVEQARKDVEEAKAERARQEADGGAADEAVV